MGSPANALVIAFCSLDSRLTQGTNPDSAVAAIQARLADRFGIRHVTMQIEPEGCADEVVTVPG